MTTRQNGEVVRDRLLDADIGAAAIEARLGCLREPHIEPLTAWIETLRSHPALPAGAGATIPWMDPDSGGIASRVLLLAQDPSPTATRTQFISQDNNDPTARCTTIACREAGLQRDIRLHWNVFPWCVNNADRQGGKLPFPDRPIQSWAAAAPVAAQLWSGLFALLPDLRVVAIMGDRSNKGWGTAVRAGLKVPAGVEVLPPGKSLSPPGFHKHRSDVIATLRAASALAAD